MTKFENEYELYYKRAAADDDIEADDGVEEAFEALHRAAEAEQQLLLYNIFISHQLAALQVRLWK